MTQFIRFETGMNEVVAVFDEEFQMSETFCINEVSLRQRIANLKKQAPGYDPSSDEAVLCELAKRNRERVAKDPLTPERLAEIDELLLRYSTSGYLLRLAGHDLWAEVTRLRKELTEADAVDELAKAVITSLKKVKMKYTCLGCGKEASFLLTRMCHAPESP